MSGMNIVREVEVNRGYGSNNYMFEQDGLQHRNLVMLLGMLPPPKSRRQKQLVMLERFLVKYPLFERLLHRNGATTLRDVVTNLIVRTYQEADTIYKLPENIRSFNLVISGEVCLYTATDSALEQREFLIDKSDVNDLKLHRKVNVGEYFGERIFTDGKGTMIVYAQATAKTVVVQLGLIMMHKAFEGLFPFRQLERVVETLRNVPAFSKIPSKKIEKILENSQRKRYSKGYTLFEEGSYAENLIVILEGEVTLRKKVQIHPLEEQSTISRNLDISILSRFDTLGIKEIMEEKPFFSTVICTSDTVEVLEIQNQRAKYILSPYSLRLVLDGDKETWRKKRISDVESNITKTTATLSPKKPEPRIDLSIDRIGFSIEDRRKLNSVQSKHKSNVERKPHWQKKTSLPKHRRCVTEESRDSSRDLMHKYMSNKFKRDTRVLMKYSYSKPPQLRQNPEKQFSVVKPLYVKKSQAIRTTMRQIKHSRKHIYNYMMRLDGIVN